MKALIVLCASLCMTQVFANTPVAAEWDKFVQEYDTNQDQHIDLTEFKYVQDFAPYSWSNDLQGKNQHAKMFKKLDQNHDGYISTAEFQHVNEYVNNPFLSAIWNENISTHL